MFIPEGHTEESVTKCILYIANLLASHYTFGHYSVEDIKQEISLECIKALHKYKPERGKLSTFLLQVASSRMINFRRDLLFRMPPKQCHCEQCQSGTPCEMFAKRMDKWRKINTSKRNIMVSTHIGDNDFEGEFSLDTLLKKRELLEIIDEYLDVNLRADYRRLLDGVRISRSRREKVLSEIRYILVNFYLED